MNTARRTNLLWGIVMLALAIVGLLQALGQLPAGIADLLARAWPALLVLLGLGVLLRDRVPAGSLIALIVSVAIVGVIAATAYSSRSTQERSDYQQSIAETVTPGTSLIRVSVRMLATDVELVRSLVPNVVTGQFVGSSESLLAVEYADAGDGTATLTVAETRPGQFPLLEAVGRGRFRLELPPDIPLDVGFSGQDGAVSLNMSGLAIERLNMDLVRGTAVVNLSAYDPRASSDQANLGTLIAREGDMTIRVPSAIAARLELNRGGSGIRPQFDPTVYNLLDLGEGVLEARNFDAAPIKQRYAVTVPRGLITVEPAAS